LTDPPPDLQLGSAPPSIDHPAVQPPEEPPLPSLPNEFVVPLEISDPTQPCFFSVFANGLNVPPYLCVPCDQSIIHFSLGNPDPTQCDTIEFTVGSSPSRPGDPECTSENDVALWYYEPPSASCNSYDASDLGDGGFPDVQADGLPFVPESGVDQ
jgi:hypothetical protein